MNIAFIARIAEKHPALGRLLELSILSGLAYLVGVGLQAFDALSTGQVMEWGDLIDPRALLVALVTPLAAAATKWRRDIQKDLEQ